MTPPHPAALRPDQLLDCAGSHQEMGLAQGQQGRAAGQAVYQAFLASQELELARPRWVPRRLFPVLARWRARRSLEGPLRRHYPEQAARMDGIARGSGLSPALLYLGLGAELLLNEVHWLPGACSALAVSGARSGSGAPMIAKNFDYPPGFRVGFCVRRSAPRGGLRSLDVTVVPLAGCHSGVNEAGLAVTYNYGYPQERAAVPLPITLLVQRMLERCARVSEALELARTAPRAGGALLTVADAAGDSAAFELSPGRCGVRPAQEGVVRCANHYLTAELAPLDVPRDAVYGPGTVPALRGERVHLSSERRLDELGRLSHGPGPLTAADLEALLRDHGPDGQASDHTICRHGHYYATTCSVVLLPAERALRVAFDAPCERPYVEHSLQQATTAAEPR